ncbi:MAG: hypothetical protein HUK20_10305, partial [Fibrobacter sp.]|nr:hypothetical protein [Fibrobacter sp.]
MASNETFVLDFKFNGNAEFLAKLESLMQRIDKTFNAVNDSAKDTEKSIDKMGDTAKDTTKSVDMMESSFGKLANTLGNVAKAYVGLQGLKKVWDFGMGSMDAYATQQKAEQQLRVVMRNQGTEDQFQGVLKEAANIQGRTIYGDEAMIAAAGELATYVKGAQSLKDMMNLLTDYAAGMTGGGAIDTQQMVGLATALGMAYDGNYRALRMKGFDTTQMQLLDALEKNGGNVTQSMINQFGVGTINDNAELIRQVKEYGQVTESMKIDALKESLSTWKGLAEEM